MMNRTVSNILPTAGFYAISLLASASVQAAQPLAQIVETPSPSERLVRNYASSLVQVEQVQSELAAKTLALPADERAVFVNEARNRIGQILSKHDLDIAMFNAISLRVDRSASLQQKVRQFAMEERIGF